MCFFKSDDDDSRSNDSRESHGNKNNDNSRKSYGYKKRNRKKRHKRRVQAVREQQESSSDESVVSGFQSFSFETIDVCGIKEAHNRDEIFAKVNIKLDSLPGSHTLKAKIDTGAQGNILPLRIFREMYPKNLDKRGCPRPGATTKRRIKLTAYNGTNITHHGTISIPCRYQNSKWIDTEFFVTDCEGPAILGLPSSRTLHIVTLNCISDSKPRSGVKDRRKAYPDRFQDTERSPGKFHVKVKDE